MKLVTQLLIRNLVLTFVCTQLFTAASCSAPVYGRTIDEHGSYLTVTDM